MYMYIYRHTVFQRSPCTKLFNVFISAKCEINANDPMCLFCCKVNVCCVGGGHLRHLCVYYNQQITSISCVDQPNGAKCCQLSSRSVVNIVDRSTDRSVNHF